MNPIYHFAVTFLILAYAYVRESNLHTLILVFLFGFLIDIDHLLSYRLATGRFTLNPLTIYRWYYEEFEERGVDLNNYLFFFHEVDVALFVSAVLVAIPEPLPYVAYLLHHVMDWIYRLNMNYNTPFLFEYMSKQRAYAHSKSFHD